MTYKPYFLNVYTSHYDKDFLILILNDQRNDMQHSSFLCRYSVDPGELDIPVGCVLRAMPDTLCRDEVEVERLDQLDGALQLEDNEELVSHIIKLSPTNPEADIKVKLHFSLLWRLL